MSARTCPECGARLGAGKERCDLCGTLIVEPAGEASAPRDDVPEPRTDDADLEDTPAAATGQAKPDGVFCNQCGWKNPGTARFCSRCGTKLQDLKGEGARVSFPPQGSSPGVRKVAETPSIPPDQDDVAEDDDADDGGSSLSAYVGIIVGLAVLVIVALYMITVVSKQGVTTPVSDAMVQIPPEQRSLTLIEDFAEFPLTDLSQVYVDSLEHVIAGAEGPDRYDLRRDLVRYYVDVGRVDRASLEQRELALTTDEPDDWRRAADLLYEWMERTEGERKEDVALVAIGALQRVLEYDEDDLDTRARLGWAYQFDARNPMEAIRQTDLVLADDPNHLMANYNRAVFLTRINRLNQALEQFNRVRDLAASDSLYLRRADAWMESIRRSMGGESSP